jgi:hypothetical protein
MMGMTMNKIDRIAGSTDRSLLPQDIQMPPNMTNGMDEANMNLAAHISFSLSV